MRRKEKEMTDPRAIEEIIDQADVCQLGLCDGGEPYVVPLCFGLKDNVLYFHSAAEGRKIDVLRRNPRVAFAISTGHELVRGEAACSWSMNYRSVMGTGHATVIEDPEEMRPALDIIMRHYGERDFTYSDAALKKMVIIRVEIENLTAKTSRE